MQNRRQLNQDLQIVKTLGEMVQAYEEIYIVKMQKIRNAVLSTRNYMSGLASVYGEVKAISMQQQRVKKEGLLTKMSRGFRKVVLPKKEKKIAVLLTGSHKLSGDINQRVFQYFQDFINANPEYSRVIVGSVGKSLYTQKRKDTHYQYFDLSEEQLSSDALQPLVTYILQFDQVQIFYGKFISLVHQQQTKSNFSGVNLTDDNIKNTDLKNQNSFIFEPSLDKLVYYFEDQILASLYKQTAHESYLSQLGSRITALEIASSNVKKKTNAIRSQQRKWVKRIRNKKQLQSIAGINLWGYK